MATSMLDGLNPAQQQAVQVVAGPCLVLAGPGSGKTRVLTRRIAYLMNEVGVDPHNILAVTFTNKAAREMRERLETMLGAGRAAALSAGTFHSLCTRFLRRDIVHLGRERDFTIYDSDDQQRLMKRVLKDLNLDEKKYPPRAIHSQISSAKNELVDADAYHLQAHSYYEEIVARCYKRYQDLLREANALDFDDLLVETVRLFEQHPRVLEKYQDRYVYLLADEYQDTNRVQYVLLKLLAAKHRNIFVVGDEDQGVYAFRGADIRNIRAFESDYPDAKVILLEQNYRSTQAILDVAQALINQSTKRARPKSLWTENDRGTLVVMQEGYDQEEEARLVAGEAARLIGSAEFRPGDIAVMYRTNAQSRAVEEALIAHGLRYVIIGGTRFYERKEVKDALAYLRLAHNPFDSVSLTRVLNWPARGIGQRSEDELNRWAAEQGVPVYVALQLLAEPGTGDRGQGTGDRGQGTDNADPDARPLIPDRAPPFSGRTRTALLAFLKLVDELIAARQTLDLGALIDLLFSRIEFQEALLREHGEKEGADRWANALELRTVAANYAGLPLETQLATFLEEVALISEVDNVKEERDAITCITLHQAKGLEFPVVFLVGLEEGLLPHARSLDDAEALDEERRLFYVGATRAQSRLYMLHAFRRATYGRSAPAAPSRFLSDIPKELLHQMPKRGQADLRQSSLFTPRATGGMAGAAARRALPAGAAPQPTQRAAPLAQRPSSAAFFAGQRVRHASFGEGVVVSSKLMDDDEEVTVAFSGKGVKRLLASFARLEKVE